MHRATLLLPLAGLLGCPSEEPLPAPEYDGTFEVPQEAVACAEPAERIEPFGNEATERGLTFQAPPEWNPGDEGGPPFGPFGSGLAGLRLAAEDVDGDGDVDVIGAERTPVVYLNDGSARFEQQPRLEVAAEGNLLAVAAADLDGDGYSEIVGAAGALQPGQESSFVIWPSAGAGAWGAPQTVYTGQSGRPAEPCSIEFGDVDGDGDLDIHYCTRNSVEGGGGSHPEQVFFNDEGSFSSDRRMQLEAYDPEVWGPWGVTSLVSTWTDFDLDGDQDLFVIGGEPTYGFPEHPPSALFVNEGIGGDGLPRMVSRAEEHGFDLSFSAMGVDSFDYNGDGYPDYIMTDVGPPRFLVSQGDSLVWVEVFPEETGLTPEEPILEFPETVGWSIDVRDLDNDGWMDVLATGGPDHGGIYEIPDELPDVLWMGKPDGTFDDMTREMGFGSGASHFGMLTADFDGNGSVDVFFHAEFWDDEPILHLNPCRSNHWINVELAGPPENTDAIGARLEFTFDGRTEVREIYSLRATAQNPSRMHQGLGGSPVVEELQVVWPDGVVSRATNVPADRLVTAVHPRAE